jgi:hypothetical protein
MIVIALCGGSAPVGPIDSGSVDRTRPPSLQAHSSWEWAMAAPGLNIYVYYRSARREGTTVSAWIDREYYSNSAGIHKSIIERRQFACGAAWGRDPHVSVGQSLTIAVCGRMIPQLAKSNGADHR